MVADLVVVAHDLGHVRLDDGQYAVAERRHGNLRFCSVQYSNSLLANT
jgi:hypothetical protein